ncbi:unnamed protein product [Arctogadus glacialis]
MPKRQSLLRIPRQNTNSPKAGSTSSLERRAIHSAGFNGSPGLILAVTSSSSSALVLRSDHRLPLRHTPSRVTPATASPSSLQTRLVLPARLPLLPPVLLLLLHYFVFDLDLRALLAVCVFNVCVSAFSHL